MRPDGNLEYALARIQARQGARPHENEWRRLEASRDLAHYLEALRSSSLARFCTRLDPSWDGHALERELRSGWRGYVDAVASWHPRAWQSWLGWLAWLPTLSLLARLARAEAAPAWLLADPVCAPLAAGTAERRRLALQHSPLRPLAAGMGAGQPLGRLWWLHWQELLPPMPAETRGLLDSMIKQLSRFIDAVASAGGSGPVRTELAAALHRAFRASAATPVASCCHLALVALDLRRLRGGLLSRCLFAPAAKEPA